MPDCLWGLETFAFVSQRSCGHLWWCPHSSKVLLIWLFTLVQLRNCFWFAFLDLGLYMELNHAKLLIVHRIDFFLTWTTICPVKWKFVKPCNMLMHLLTFYDLGLEWNFPVLLTPKHWSLAFTLNRALPQCILHRQARSTSKHCETLQHRVRKSTILWTADPVLPLGISPISISWDAENFPAFHNF